MSGLREQALDAAKKFLESSAVQASADLEGKKSFLLKKGLSSGNYLERFILSLVYLTTYYCTEECNEAFKRGGIGESLFHLSLAALSLCGVEPVVSCRDPSGMAARTSCSGQD